MDEIEILKAIGEIAQSITITGILIYWVFLERKARENLSSKILDDWDELRRDRKYQADEKAAS